VRRVGCVSGDPQQSSSSTLGGNPHQALAGQGDQSCEGLLLTAGVYEPAVQRMHVDQAEGTRPLIKEHENQLQKKEGPLRIWSGPIPETAWRAG